MRSLVAALVLAVPAATLGGLAGFAASRPDGSAAAACAAWAREYRDARDDLAAAVRLWREAQAPGVRRPLEPDDVRARVGELADARPARCPVDTRPSR